MVRAVIFDFFGVLVTEGFKQFCDTYFPNDKPKRRQAVALVTSHDAGTLTKDQYTRKLAKLAGVNTQEVLEHMSGNEPNKQLISYIKNNIKPKYKIGVLSNSGEDYIGQILDPEDGGIFDDIVLSYRFSTAKPDPKFYELAATRLGVSPKECVFIDDSASHCAGAEAVGMRAIWYQSFPKMKKELEQTLSSGAA